MKKTDFLKEALQKREREGTLRILLPEQAQLIDLASNDYLGFARSLSLSEKIEKEYATLVHQEGIQPYLGATGSRLLTGNRLYAERLESQISSFHHAEAALLFNSGYVANMGLLSSLAGKGDCIVFDTQVHASTWEGAGLSGARILLFRHNDSEHLEKQLRRARATHERVLVCVESLYSMEGDVAPLTEICDLCEKYDALLIVDEAHATGVFGPQGAGLVVENGEEDRVFARVHTFGKALGLHGAVVCGSQLLRDYLINFSKPFIYTTAFPLHSLVSIRCVYDSLAGAVTERKCLFQLISYLTSKVHALSLPILTTNTPIQSIVVPGNEAVTELAMKFYRASINVKAIKSPTVRRGQERVRICVHAFNTKDHMDQLVGILAEGLCEFSVA